MHNLLNGTLSIGQIFNPFHSRLNLFKFNFVRREDWLELIEQRLCYRQNDLSIQIVEGLVAKTIYFFL